MDYGRSPALPCPSIDMGKLKQIQHHDPMPVGKLGEIECEVPFENLCLSPTHHQWLSCDLVPLRKSRLMYVRPEIHGCDRTRDFQLTQREQSSVGLPLVHCFYGISISNWDCIPDRTLGQYCEDGFKHPTSMRTDKTLETCRRVWINAVVWRDWAYAVSFFLPFTSEDEDKDWQHSNFISSKA